MRNRLERDVMWSTVQQINLCIHCGQPAWRMPDDTFMCLNDPDCLAELNEDESDVTPDCASEGYVVFASDQ